MKKVYVFLTVILALTGQSLMSQAPGADVSTIRSIRPRSDSTFLVQEFTGDSTLLFYGTFSSVNPDVRHGRFMFYTEKGEVEAAGFYYKDIPYGKWIFYDAEGRVARVMDYKYVLDFLLSCSDSIPGYPGNISGRESQPFTNEMAERIIEYGEELSAGQQPGFRGGNIASFMTYIRERLIYPVFARDMGITGKVIVRFTLGTDGRITQASILSGKSPDLNMEALRVVLESNGWNPAKSADGRPVEVTLTVPVEFTSETMRVTGD